MTADASAPDDGYPAGTAEGAKAGAGLRALALLGSILLFSAAAIAAIAVINPDDTPRCEEAAGLGGECFDITATQETISTILFVPAGILAALAGLVGLVVLATGRRGGLMLRLGGIAVALGAVAVVVNQL